MRIIAGEYKGRRITAPEDTSVRPTTGKVKEAIFAMLMNDIYDAVTVDLFAGTGNLGLEALSRGARKCYFGDKRTTIVPIYGNGERIGTLIVAKYDREFNDEDLLLAEYAAAVIGVEILHERAARVEEEARKKAMVQIAFSTLSFSELEAINSIMEALNGTEGLLVASKIADSVGITRSVIVNALRKFESAGLIETKSLGMKGTYIRVKNEFLLDELKKEHK